jgi:formyltetrahydrofolate-dependent phosphoribosylglycinamide formyltransferase
VSEPLRLVVLVSGAGSNLQAVLDAIRAGTLYARVVAVVSNRQAAPALERAEQAEISTVYAPLRPYTTAGRPREDYDRDLAELVKQLGPDLVVCAGWMHLFTPAFLEHVGCRVINLHPALPGQFPGLNAIGRALESARRGEIGHTGVMVHEVVAEVDAGPVIAKAEVPILPADDQAALEARMHAVEHVLLVDALRSLAAAHLTRSSS